MSQIGSIIFGFVLGLAVGYTLPARSSEVYDQPPAPHYATCSDVALYSGIIAVRADSGALEFYSIDSDSSIDLYVNAEALRDVLRIVYHKSWNTRSGMTPTEMAQDMLTKCRAGNFGGIRNE